MRSTAKRLLDMAVAGAALIGTGPLFGVLAVVIRLDSKGPVLYRGTRIGRGTKPFRLLKFRTMVQNAETLGGPSTADSDGRVTRVGRFLRTYKLDELPQFINILLGDMSLVGPRPQVPTYLDRYNEEERTIFSVRPGITDWASIRFHNEGQILASSGMSDVDKAYDLLIHPEKTRLQLKYLREQSLLVDLQILFQTASTLIRTRARAQTGSK